MITTRKAYAENDKLLATLNEVNERIVKDPSKTYLVWKGDKFPNSTDATFKASEGCTIDWGDGNVETFETTSTEVNTHNYTDGIEYHLISISNRILINDKEFKNCVGLICLELSDKVKYIRNSAFNGCKFLTSITLHNGLVGIGDSAFFKCIGLTSITIPDSVENIDRSAFSNCHNLKTIKILAENPPTIVSSAFAVGSNDRVIVPKSSIDAYKSADGWSTYADKIVYETDSSEYENTFWLSGGILIQPNTDLNTLTTVGNYYASNTANISNVPLGTFGPFTLKVSSVPDGSNFLIQQQFTQYLNGNTYTRVRKTDGSWESIGSALGSYGSGWSVAYNTITAAIIDFTRKEAKALLNLNDEYDGPIIVPVKALIQCAVNHYSTRACLRVGGVGSTLAENPLYYGLQIEGLPAMDDFLVHIDIKSYNSDAWITLETTNKTYQCFYNSNYYAKTINGEPNPLYDARPKWIYVPRAGYRDTAVKYKEDADGNKTYTDVDGSTSNTMPIPTGNIGSVSKPVYLSDGQLAASSANIGGANQPIWMDNGVLKNCSGEVGDTNHPIWMNSDGVLTECGKVAEAITADKLTPIQVSHVNDLINVEGKSIINGCVSFKVGNEDVVLYSLETTYKIPAYSKGIIVGIESSDLAIIYTSNGESGCLYYDASGKQWHWGIPEKATNADKTSFTNTSFVKIDSATQKLTDSGTYQFYHARLGITCLLYFEKDSVYPYKSPIFVCSNDTGGQISKNDKFYFQIEGDGTISLFKEKVSITYDGSFTSYSSTWNSFTLPSSSVNEFYYRKIN